MSSQDDDAGHLRHNAVMLQQDLIRKRLTPPTQTCRVVMDTDTYNEVDDQFALAYMMRSPERAAVEAVYAAPFHNERSNGPEDGMLKSYDEILNILKILGDENPPAVFKGSTRYMTHANDAVDSDAARDLVARAMDGPEDQPLYVLTIGAITNVASALVIEPKLVERIVVVWLGGHSLGQPNTKEFNLRQDPNAARVVFDSGVPLVWVPCGGVASHLLTTVPELETYMPECGEIGHYLLDIVKGYSQNADAFAWSKVIWDISTVAWMVNENWLPSTVISSPILNDDLTWTSTTDRHPIRAVYHVRRNEVFADLFRKLEKT